MSTLSGGPNVITNSLVFSYDIANSKSYTNGALTLNSLGLTQTSGSILNGPTYNSANGGSLVFDGTNDYVKLDPSTIPTGNEITIGIWSYGVNLVPGSIFAASNGSDRTINIHLPWNNNVVYWDCGNDGANYDRVNTSTLSSIQWQNSWHYWVFTKNTTAGTMGIYLDGNLNTSGTSKTRTIKTSLTASIGAFILSPTSYYQSARVAKLDVYNRALTATEILQNYNTTKTRFGLF